MKKTASVPKKFQLSNETIAVLLDVRRRISEFRPTVIFGVDDERPKTLEVWRRMMERNIDSVLADPTTFSLGATRDVGSLINQVHTKQAHILHDADMKAAANAFRGLPCKKSDAVLELEAIHNKVTKDLRTAFGPMWLSKLN
jgi:hypothetical protein